MIKITPSDDIQAALDRGGEMEFAPGVYTNAHYTITKPVHLKGYGAILAGGTAVSWKREGEDLVCETGLNIPARVLVVNGSLRTRARYPDTGFAEHDTVFDVPWMSTTGGGWKRKPTHEELSAVTVKPGAVKGLTLDSAEITLIHSWDDSLLTVASVEGDKIIFVQESGHPAGSFGVRKYCLWNLPEAFTGKGTFYHDIKAGKIRYKPLDGEDERTPAYLPTGYSIFDIKETAGHSEIEGFELTVTDTPRVTAGFGAQAMPGAVEISGGLTGCRLHDIKIKAVGGYGIKGHGTLESNDFFNLEISGTGAGGVSLYSGITRDKSVLRDSHIRHTGFYYPSAIGIAAGNIHILRNHVHHTTYSIINCGGDDFSVEGNILHDGMEVLNDGAAIYSFGSHRGIMRGNLAYNMKPSGGEGLRIAYYLDETASDWLVENNAAIGCAYPNHNHMCGNHLYRHNLFVNNDGDMKITLQRSRSITYTGNVFIASGDIVFHTPDDGIAGFTGNRIHSADGTVKRNRLADYAGSAAVIMELDRSNSMIPEYTFDESDRLFVIGDFVLDLRQS